MNPITALFYNPTRKIGLLVPGLVISENHTDSLTITEHPVENGASIADHAFRKPASVIMEVSFGSGGALLDMAPGLTAGWTPWESPQQSYEQLLKLLESKAPFEVTTGKRVYKNMMLTQITVKTDVSSEYVLNAGLTLTEVMISETAVLHIPANKQDMQLGADTSAPQTGGLRSTVPASKPLQQQAGG